MSQTQVTSPSIDPATFRETLGHYPTGVAVVTVVDGDGMPDGMVVGTFSSVSLDPPLVAFFPAKGSRSFERMRDASSFCVNVLAAEQEPLCRQLASPGDKFGGVGWRPAPMGAPVLDGVVSWIECTFEDVREAGDHLVVLGRVQALAVERSTLPLLFFQGGYGRFSPGSFVAAAPDPELIQAAHLAETIRTQVEELSERLGVNVSVLAKIRDDAVQVLAANQAAVADSPPLGHRQPIIPPLGAVFMADAGADEVEAWLRRDPDDGPATRERHTVLLDRVRERGYSLLAAEPEALERHRLALSEYERSDRLPRHGRAVEQATAELADLFCPDLAPGESYDVASVVVLVPAVTGRPAMALRMTGLALGAPTEQIEGWVRDLTAVADAASRGRA